jgi:thiosulfate/3-mercaptopyruvate sulfurtransferase
VYPPIVSVTELQELLSTDPLILDCRFDLSDTEAGRRAYGAGHIPGAHYLHLDADLSGPIIPDRTGRHPLPDRAVFAAKLAGLGLTADRTVVAYDDKGGGIAARAWWLLRDLGHEKVAVLDGGLSAWRAADGQLSRSAGTCVPAPPLDIADGRLPIHDRDEVDKLRGKAGYTLIDSRTAERYRGEHEPIDPVAGHIPGAINLPWPENLSDGKLKSREELRERFAGLQNEPQRNVFYCGSGVTACHNTLAYYYAFERMPALYPGSWSEYLLREKG